MNHEPEKEDAITARAWRSSGAIRSRRPHRYAGLTWGHDGVLELAWGWQSNHARHLVLRAYATKVREETAAHRARVELLDGDDRTLVRAVYLLPLCRVDLAELVFYERASFAWCEAWPPAPLPVLAEKDAEARLHVLRALDRAASEGLAPADSEETDKHLEAAARFLDLAQAELVLLLHAGRSVLGVAWLGRVA